MLKEFLWKAFEKTGNIDAYIFIKEIEQKDSNGEDHLPPHEEVPKSSNI